MKITNAEKMTIAGYAAPRLRNGMRRRVHVYDIKTGAVIRETDTIEITQKLLERAGIEFDVIGRKPRPPKPRKPSTRINGSPRKNETINIRVTTEQKKELERAATAAGISTSTWMVVMCLKIARKE